MVYGGQEQERIPFNEDTLWNGEPGINDRPNAAKVLPEIRQLLFEGRQQEAEGLASSSFMGDPEVLDAYQIFGTLLIDCPGYGQLEDYRRELDLNFGLVTVKYRARGVDYTRQTFCSEPDQVLVWHIQASEPEQINLAIGLECPHPNTRIESISNPPNHDVRPSTQRSFKFCRTTRGLYRRWANIDHEQSHSDPPRGCGHRLIDWTHQL